MAAKTNEIRVVKFNAWNILLRQFKNPLLLVFIIATVVSYILGQKVEATVIWIVMFISVSLGFWNEYQAEKIVNDLIKKISFTAEIIKDGVKEVIPVKDVKVNDKIILHTGSIVPADIKLDSTDNLEVNESILTGESLPIVKNNGEVIYMGTVITGGNASGIVTGIGMDTKFGKISEELSHAKPQTEFQKGLRDFSLLLTRIAGVAVVLVVAFGWFLNHPIVETILFALTVAMGITPELLPLIVTIGLSRGARKLAKEAVVVKRFVSIEDLGNMEVLCTDKTGTLTEGKIELSSFINSEEKTDPKVLELSLICNSGFIHKHTANNSIDGAIMNYAKEKKVGISGNPKILHEIPFNFESRFMSVFVNREDQTQLICKGSPEVIITKCSLETAKKKNLKDIADKMQADGIRVIAIASKKLKTFDKSENINKYSEMNFEGFLGFLDTPKKDLATTFDKFAKLGVVVKILTGDNEVVAKKVCKDVGFHFNKVMTGEEISNMNDSELLSEVWKTEIFARVTPSQKVRIIETLKKGDHTIGYLGDGVNDGPALHMADAGISVNSGVDVAKDAASIVLMRKSLGVIADGILEGRKTFQNTIKYILMGTSSDFGNMVSAAAASIFLPFLPMAPVQVLLTDILYDTSQIAIPMDNVDADQIKTPKSWNIGYIKRFMLLFGPISTIYDFITFGIMYFFFHARNGFFQTGWFIESLITEIMVVFVIRTRKIPFWKSKPSKSLLAACISIVVIGLILPFSPLAVFFDFQALPVLFFIFLIGLTLTYLLLVEVGKYILNHETNNSKS